MIAGLSVSPTISGSGPSFLKVDLVDANQFT